jgi:hypothetical protein
MSIVERVAKVVRDPEMARFVVASRFPRFDRSADECAALELPSATPEECASVRSVLTRHGSDKADPHTYGDVYAGILRSLPTNPRILELGIGTNFADVPCNMGVDGVPGASLRAFRELRPDASVAGADIDRRVLFEEEGIETYWVDQLDLESLRSLRRQLGGESSIDLIIDDGLHLKRSNLNSLRELLPALKSGGYYVVEDVDGSALDFWRFVLAKLHLTGVVLEMSEWVNDSDINNLVVVSV